jgi:hypothetical protein
MTASALRVAISAIFLMQSAKTCGRFTRIALLDIKPTFDLNMHDWRAIAVLDYLVRRPFRSWRNGPASRRAR